MDESEGKLGKDMDLISPHCRPPRFFRELRLGSGFSLLPTVQPWESPSLSLSLSFSSDNGKPNYTPFLGG